jgi:hypothetical protein
LSAAFFCCWLLAGKLQVPPGHRVPLGRSARKVLPDQWDPKVRLDCKDQPAPRAFVERLAPPDNLECLVPPECPAPRASVAR